MIAYDRWLDSGNPEDDQTCPECDGPVVGDKWSACCDDDDCDWFYEADYESDL